MSKPTAVMTVRLSSEDRERINQAAKSANKSTNKFCAELLIQAADLELAKNGADELPTELECVNDGKPDQG